MKLELIGINVSCVLLYVLIGLITLLVMLRIGLKDADDSMVIHEALGDIVLWGVVGWPYIWINRLFFFEFWLKPVKGIR